MASRTPTKGRFKPLYAVSARPIVVHRSDDVISKSLVPLRNYRAVCQNKMACVAETNGGRLMRLGYSPAQRKQLYYGVCVPIRIALAVAIFITAWKAPKPTAWTAATLGTAIALYNAYLATQRGCRWCW